MHLFLLHRRSLAGVLRSTDAPEQRAGGAGSQSSRYSKGTTTILIVQRMPCQVSIQAYESEMWRPAVAHVPALSSSPGDETSERATIQLKDPNAPNATLRWSGTNHMLIISTGTHIIQHACTVSNQPSRRRSINLLSPGAE